MLPFVLHALRCDLCAQLLANLWEDLQLHGEGEGDVGGANDAKYDDSYAGSSASERLEGGWRERGADFARG